MDGYNPEVRVKSMAFRLLILFLVLLSIPVTYAIQYFYQEYQTMPEEERVKRKRGRGGSVGYSNRGSGGSMGFMEALFWYNTGGALVPRKK